MSTYRLATPKEKPQQFVYCDMPKIMGKGEPVFFQLDASGTKVVDIHSCKDKNAPSGYVKTNTAGIFQKKSLCILRELKVGERIQVKRPNKPTYIASGPLYIVCDTGINGPLATEYWVMPKQDIDQNYVLGPPKTYNLPNAADYLG